MPAPVLTPESMAELFADPPLVGRREDLQRLEALLEHPPALAVVGGERGSGKSSLLAAFIRRAAARGWRCIQLPPVRPATDRDTLVRALRSRLGLSEEPSLTTGDVPGEQLLGRPADVVGRTAAPAGSANTLLNGLARQRTVLLLDDFHPSRDVERWLLDDVLAELRDAHAPVVLVLAGRAAYRRNRARVDEVLEAHPPTVAELRQHLAALGSSLDPPAEEAEVDVLAAEVVSVPHLIGPLIRALSYARTDG